MTEICGRSAHELEPSASAGDLPRFCICKQYVSAACERRRGLAEPIGAPPGLGSPGLPVRLARARGVKKAPENLPAAINLKPASVRKHRHWQGQVPVGLGLSSHGI